MQTNQSKKQATDVVIINVPVDQVKTALEGVIFLFGSEITDAALIGAITPKGCGALVHFESFSAETLSFVTGCFAASFPAKNVVEHKIAEPIL